MLLTVFINIVNIVSVMKPYIIRLYSGNFSSSFSKNLAVILSFFSLFFLPLFTLAAETESSIGFQNLEKGIRRVELQNGLRLIMVERGRAPVVACYMKFLAGSYDESWQNAGIAHMLEHMLFKGTQKVGTVDFAREEKYLRLIVRFSEKLDIAHEAAKAAEERGEGEKAAQAKAEMEKWRRRIGQLKEQSRGYIVPEEHAYIYSLNGAVGYNAYTTADLTNYQIKIPANRLEVWARLEADRMENSVLRQFYTERDVVLEERRMRVENIPQRKILEQFLAKIYHEHPYGRPVIGPRERIGFLSYRQAEQFYRTYYAPNNLVIALVGGIDMQKAEVIVKKYFGRLQPRLILRKKTVPPQQRQVKISAETSGAPLLLYSWLKPPLPQVSAFNLDILAELLAGDEDTRLHRRLVVKEKLAAEVSAWSGYPGERADNLFLIRVTPLAGASENKITAYLLEEIEKISNGDIGRDELQRTGNRRRTELLVGLQENSRLADLLSYFEIMTGSYKNFFAYNSYLDQITSEQIGQTAKRYLQKELMMTAALRSKESKEQSKTSYKTSHLLYRQGRQ